MHVGELLCDSNGMSYVGLTSFAFLSGMRCGTKFVSGSNLGELCSVSTRRRTPWPRLPAPGSFDRIVAA